MSTKIDRSPNKIMIRENILNTAVKTPIVDVWEKTCDMNAFPKMAEDTEILYVSNVFDPEKFIESYKIAMRLGYQDIQVAIIAVDSFVERNSFHVVFSGCRYETNLEHNARKSKIESLDRRNARRANIKKNESILADKKILLSMRNRYDAKTMQSIIKEMA